MCMSSPSSSCMGGVLLRWKHNDSFSWFRLYFPVLLALWLGSKENAATTQIFRFYLSTGVVLL